MSLLLGLMCKFSCEECEFRAFGADGQHMSVVLKDGTILQNMESVLEEIKSKVSTVLSTSCRGNNIFQLRGYALFCPIRRFVYLFIF